MYLNKEQQLEILIYYFGSNFELKRAYVSPLPEEYRGKRDCSPSFNIFYDEQNSKYKWKDFGAGGLSGDVIDLIEIKEPSVTGYRSALEFYRKNIKGSFGIGDKLVSIGRKHSSKKNFKPEVKVREMTAGEKKFWTGPPLLITEDKIRRRRINALKSLQWGGKFTEESSRHDPAYIIDFSEKGDLSSWKLYRPYTRNSKKKWKSWNTTAIPFEGYFSLPDDGEVLFFCSGTKDSLTCEMCNPNNWAAAAPFGEGAWRKILNFKYELEQRFDRIFILFDGDAAGIKAAKQFSNETGWNALYLDYKSAGKIRGKWIKDISEVVEVKGYNLLKNLILEEIWDLGIRQ